MSLLTDFFPSKDNLNATVPPTVNNDSSATQGYSIGSRWIDTVTGRVYTATSVVVGAAVWPIATDPSWTLISAAYTAVANDRLMVDTSVNAISITLPATPVIGDTIMLFDYSGTFATHNAIIGPGLNPVNGVTGIFQVSTAYASLSLLYTGLEWRLL